MECHNDCGWCCIILSTEWSPAGKRCEYLNEEDLCSIYDERPLVCRTFKPSIHICGKNPEEAKQLMVRLN